MGFVEQLIFILSGFSVVMVALAGLWGISVGSGWIIRTIETRLSPHATAPAPVAASTPMIAVPSTGIPAQHVAALSAAVAVMTSGRGRIAQIYAPAHRVTAWAQGGRIEHFASHRVRSDWAVVGPPHSTHLSAPAPTERTP